jgi:hypothetical protein
LESEKPEKLPKLEDRLGVDPMLQFRLTLLAVVARLLLDELLCPDVIKLSRSSLLLLLKGPLPSGRCKRCKFPGDMLRNRRLCDDDGVEGALEICSR